MVDQAAPHATRGEPRLAGTVCLVTGASRGVGRSTATKLVREGAQVLGTYRSAEQEARDLAATLANGPGGIDFERCDITEADEVEALARRALDGFGRVDVLVNNAGIWRGGRLVDLQESDWRSVIETNLMGVFRVTRALLPAMIAAGSGRIVNVSSVVGMIGYPGDTAYGAAKAGLIGFTRCLAKEVAREGIAVNAVAPGSLTTDMTDELSDRARKRLVDRIPAGRQGDPMEIADVIAYLADAPTYLTGAVVSIAGAM